MIKSVVWTSMLDYPKEISTTLFIGECNWNCEYCHNKDLVKLSNINFKNEILPKLLKRKEIIKHVVLSGGECTCYNKINELIKVLKQNNFIIGIHTNGSNPNILKENIDKINYIGMDIKTSKEKYYLIIKEQLDFNLIIDSMKLIIKSNVKYEFRTTLYPKYVNTNDCIKIAQLIKNLGGNNYVIQQFNNCNVENYNVIPYSTEEIIKIKYECDKIIPTIIRD